MHRELLVAIVAALGVVGAYLLLGPREPIAAPKEFPRYTDAEREAGVDRMMGEVRFDGVAMEGALNELARTSGTTIVVDWGKVEGGAARQTPVYVQLHNVELGRAIEAVCGDVEGGKSWRAEKGKILVPAGGERAFSRVYEVEDLIAESVALDASLGLPSVPAKATSAEDARRVAGKRLEEILRYAVARDPDGVRVDYWSGRVLAVLGRAGHRKIERTLNLMRTHKAPGARPATRPSVDLLARMVPPVRFQNRPLREALAEMARSSGVDFAIDWRGLGDDPDRRISLHIKAPAPLGRALSDAMHTSYKQTEARCQTDDGIVVIGVGSSLRRATVRIYDVRDIIRAMVWHWRHFTEPIRGDGPAIVTRHYSSGFGPGVEPAPATAQEGGDFMAFLVTDLSSAEIWMEHGGSGGFVCHFAGRLVVEADAQTHPEVERFVAGLREWFRDRGGGGTESFRPGEKAGKP